MTLSECAKVFHIAKSAWASLLHDYPLNKFPSIHNSVDVVYDALSNYEKESSLPAGTVEKIEEMKRAGNSIVEENIIVFMAMSLDDLLRFTQTKNDKHLESAINGLAEMGDCMLNNSCLVDDDLALSLIKEVEVYLGQ